MKYNLIQISSHLSTADKFSVEKIYSFEELESTNTWLLSQNDVDGKCCVTTHQTAGKGRRGKVWADTKGSSILLSMGWQVDQKFIPGVSLVAGLAVIDALSDIGVQGVRLKWPNDILAGGRKLGGVLVEFSGKKLVVGLGLNLHLKDTDTYAIDQPWTDLKSMGHQYDENLLMARILYHHGNMVTDCVNNGFSGYSARWNAVHAFAGRKVRVDSKEETFSGVAKGVNGDGALIVQSESDERTVVTGTVFLQSNTR